MNISKLYENGSIIGWSYNLAKENFKLTGRTIPRFKDFGKIVGDRGKRRALYEYVRLNNNGSDLVHIPQEIGDPFIAGTMVVMSDGSEKAIEDICIGDSVINHKGEVARVTNVIKKQFTGNLITIKLRGHHRELTATETHHGMILPYNQYRFKYSGVERVKFGELEVGDYMLIPFGNTKSKNIIIDLANYLQKESIFDDNFIYDKNEKINRFINVDNDFARLIGLYLAEGGVDKNNALTYWCFNSNEQLYIDEIKNLVKSIFGIECKVHKTGVDSCLRVVAKSNLLKIFIKKYVDGDIYSKKIPIDFFNVGIVTRISLIRGWLDGDGYKKFNINTVIGYTSSDNLGNDMTRLARSCGMNVTSWRRMRKTRSRVPNTEIGWYGTEPYKVYDDVASIKNPKTISCNNTPYGWARPIKEIKRTAVVDEIVYCITTENEYTAIFNGIAQYQCVGWGTRHALTYTYAAEITVRGDREKFCDFFPPYFYACGRVFIGGGQLGNSDGSTGDWARKALLKYGALKADESGVPRYSGAIAKQWGRSGPPQNFVTIAQPHIIKEAMLVETAEQAAQMIWEGYAINVCSMQGFNMMPDSNGFHQPRGAWAHCFPGDTVVMSEIPKLASDIKVGDILFTRNNKSSVKKISVREYSGRIVNIKVSGLPWTKFTPEHPILIYRPFPCHLKIKPGTILEEYGGGNYKYLIEKFSNYSENQPIWVKAEDIQPGDYVLMPKLDKDIEIIVPDWDYDEVSEQHVKNKPNKLYYNDDLGWLFGLYIGDGTSVKNHKIVITLGLNEEDIAIRAKEIIEQQFGIQCSILYKYNCIRVVCYSTVVSNTFCNWFGKHIDKQIPEWLYNYRAISVVYGLMDSDGGVYNNLKYINNISYKVIYSAYHILLSNNEYPRIDFIDKKYENCNNGYRLEWFANKGKNVRSSYWDNFYCKPIIASIEEVFDGPVYDYYMDGDDFNFAVNGFIVHNSMCIYAYEEHPRFGLIFKIRNSWDANAHGQLKDFETGVDLPVCTIRTTASVVNRMLREQDSFAYSDFIGFPDNSEKLNRADFKLTGRK